MKKLYEQPELEILRLQVEDIITESNRLPVIPADLDDEM